MATSDIDPCRGTNQLENEKFALDSNTNVTVRVTDDDGNAVLEEIRDNGVDAVPSGLATAGRITEVTLNDTGWTALPATALTDRNGMGIQNPNSTQIKLNFDNSEPSFIGWSVNANGEAFIDIRDSVVIYARAASGSPVITIMEVS